MITFFDKQPKKSTKAQIKAMMRSFTDKYTDFVHNGLVFSDYLLLSSNLSPLASMIKARQREFEAALKTKIDSGRKPVTWDYLRHIDSVRSQPLWSRVMGAANYNNHQTSFLLAEQLQAPALSLFLDTAMFEANVSYNFNFNMLLGGLRSSLEEHGFYLELPDYPSPDITYGIASMNTSLRSCLALKMKWMSLAIFHLKPGQDLSELKIDTPHAVVLQAGKLFWLNTQDRELKEIQNRPDLLHFLAAQPQNRMIESNLQEFKAGYPPVELEKPADLAQFLSPKDQGLLGQIEDSEHKFKTELEPALIKRDEVEARYEKELEKLGFELMMPNQGFSQNFFHIFNAMGEGLSQEKLLLAMQLFEAFYTDLAEFRAMRDRAYQGYQEEMNRLFPVLVPLVEQTHVLRGEASYLDELNSYKTRIDGLLLGIIPQWPDDLHTLMAKKTVQIEKDLAAQRKKYNQILTRLGERQAQQLAGLSSLSWSGDNPQAALVMTLQTKAINLYYAEQRTQEIAQLNQLNLKAYLGETFAAWTSLAKALKTKPLVLGPKEMPALQLLYPDYSAEQLISMQAALSFWGNYHQIVCYETFEAKKIELITRIEDEMQELALHIKRSDTPEQKEIYYALQDKKLALQQEIAWIDSHWEEFLGLTDAEKERKIPHLWGELSPVEHQILGQLPASRPEDASSSSLLQLSQYPGLLPSHAWPGLGELDQLHRNLAHVSRPYHGYELDEPELRAAAAHHSV